MDYKQILEDVIELNESLVIIRGYGDVYDLEVGSGSHIHYIRGFKWDQIIVIIWIKNKLSVIDFNTLIFV